MAMVSSDCSLLLAPLIAPWSDFATDDEMMGFDGVPLFIGDDRQHFRPLVHARRWC